MRSTGCNGEVWLCVAVAFLGAVPSGCTSRRAAPSSIESRLQVVRVGLQGGAQSGFPISESIVLTAAHGWFCGQPVAAVDGLPARVGRHMERIGHDDMQAVDDWVALGVLPSGRQFEPNLIDPSVPAAPGTSVTIGGFPKARLNADLWDRAPTIVTGRVVEFDPPRTKSRGLIWVEVPAVDLRGFSGGPVAVESPQGPIVFGIVTRGFWDPIRAFTGRQLVGVARLDAAELATLGSRPVQEPLPTRDHPD